LLRAERRQPVSQHDPVGGAEKLAAPAARFLHHIGVMAGAGDAEGFGIDRAEHIEIDKTVVERRDQRIGQ
jgi:hypothetical protein